MRSVVVLQARTTSSRLPAKVLLTIAGLPLAVLCANRLANGGARLLVATSDQTEDDHLAQILEAHGIAVFRGPLDDVLGRFVAALEAEPDDTIVVRATADNPLPDGGFLEDFLVWYRESGVVYGSTEWGKSRLPYGMGLEAMPLSALRAAHTAAEAADDPAYAREHVTPLVIGTHGEAVCGTLTEVDLSKLRVTVDTLDDYLTIANLFSAPGVTAKSPWRTILACSGSIDHSVEST